MNLTRHDFPDRIELTVTDADSAMIWLHGLGATADDFVPVFAHIAAALPQRIRSLFPQAPQRPVTISGGMPMPSWYDILAASPQRQINAVDLQASAGRVQELIETLITSGMDSRRIFIAGFSQGGAVALQSALTCRHPLGGLICLSTYLAQPLQVQPANQSLPVWFAHGTVDAVVPYALGENSYRQLQQLGLTPQWHDYPMDHEVCMEEIAGITAFVQQQLQPA